MKLTYEDNDGRKIVIEDKHDGQDVHEMQEHLEQLLLAMGYHPDCVYSIFSKYTQESI